MIVNGVVLRRSRRFLGRYSVVAAAVVVAVLGLSACGGSDASQEEINKARKQTANHVHKEVRLRKLEKELRHIKKGGSPSAPPQSGSSAPPTSTAPSSCGEELSAGPATTCPFAANVKAAYFSEIGSGSGTVEAYSPVTGKYYSMYCTGSPHQCTGGNNASVYFP